MGTKKLTAALILCAAAAFAATPKIQLGVTKYEAAKFSQDYEIYGKESAFYREHGICAALIDYDNMIKTNRSQAELARDLKRHHVVFLRVMNEGVHQAGPQQMAYAEKVGKTLLEYVKAGGGLIIQPCTVRYPGDDDEKYWNQVYKPFGFQLEREGVADLTTMKMIQDRAEMSQNFFYTSNVVKHPATAGINGLWLPVWNAGCNKSSGSPYLTLSPEWKVIIKGNATAKTFRVTEKNHIDLNQPGTKTGDLPICAVRNIGKGRVAVLSASFMHTGLNVGLASWYQIAESVGADNKPGQTMDLMLNLVNWCSEPSRKLAGFGTYDPPKYERVKYAESVSFDHYKFGAKAPRIYKGILGAHTSFTDGKNTVAEYVAAAKKNGLSFIVFADPLEKLSKEKLEQLKKDCIANSSADFIACPGVEFTDGAGIRQFFYGPKIIWPGDIRFRKGKYEYQLWDGKVIKHFGHYVEQSGYCANGVIDFKDLKKNRVPRENLWWFFRIITHSFDHDKQIADNMEDYKFLLRDVRWLSPIAFTRITAADQIPMAMSHAVTSMKSMASVKDMLSTRANSY